ncbi:MAG: nitrous oxide-stimulated promoter family protein [Selenomonadaceae bacterium]|uniref:nitrous oxide-stimulated promoter family protein n=1 Tax=Anaerovibrio slackiae TaxID=2652309 RepID=UPI0038709D1B|nr:nitrous oxide-stimulated promoter family protein [Selenomonadaceae bacterium]MBQ5919516.1 nitrous oxide-stimulated promoter family protein [Selenomonadaceae bacterium]MBR0358375.1 nitrous oxide-stimulated promoter family protein [Selenomonadaceae bacterium]MCI6483276.1 nitrous oxide-stimulated promoter family protein [Selenomonadaceae bacterium]
MGIFDRFLPKKKQPEVKNTIPQEKANIKKTFGVYCNKHHNTKGEKLCPKCTALLATVMTKINRCPYGITKPICDRCERQCFGKAQNTEFMKIMTSSSKGMFLKHPMMTMKHKMASLSVDYAKREQEKRQAEKAAAKKKNAEAKAKAKEEGKKEK